MKVSIAKSEVSGKLVAPSSKSYTIRGFISAAMAPGESQIINPLASADTEAAMSVLKAIGVKIREESGVWKVKGGNFHVPSSDLYCAESATTFRFMTAISALVPGACHLVPAPGLAKRPIKPLLDALSQLGVRSSLDEDGSLTVLGGTLRGGRASLPGNISSQFISALLLATPLAPEGAEIEVTPPLESKPYVQMTIECLGKFGIKIDSSSDLLSFRVARQRYQPARYQVEGDWSSASYLLALGAVLGETEVLNLNPASLQGDKVLLDFLDMMGADIKISKECITVKKKKLKGIKANLKDSIDLLPTMGVLAAIAQGETELSGIARARLKESNRVSAVREGLVKMGIKVKEEKDRLLITGGKPRGALIDSRNDHRIAMSFAILGGLAGDTVIAGAECVAKTFPEFWDVVTKAGMRLEINDR
ncbi:MAG: 3-phosphoshikimate 1-carboxyvinyltransferase [Chloroflexota bacterium]